MPQQLTRQTKDHAPGLTETMLPHGYPRFSKHAQERMARRAIQFTSDQLLRLGRAVAAVVAKGGATTLVMLDQTALVVSLNKGIVVTVIDQPMLKDNVFTNIDSVIFA